MEKVVSVFRKADLWFWVKLITFIFLALFLVWPFSSLIIRAFQSSNVEGFTLSNFRRFFDSPYYYKALFNSLKVAIIPTVFSVIIGVPIAYLMSRTNVWAKKLWYVIIILSLMSPAFLGAYSWILMFGRSGFMTKLLESILHIKMPTIYGMGGICAVLTLKRFPYVYLYTAGAMSSIDASLEECAENLGSSKLRRMLTVTVPIVLPSVAAGALMVFMSSFADFGTPMLLGENFRTLPAFIYNEFLGETGTNGNYASAIAVIMVTISLAVLTIQKYIINRKNYVMTSMRPPAEKQYRGLKRVLVTLPVAIVALCTFIPQIVIIVCSFMKSNYGTFVGGFTLENYTSIGKRFNITVYNTFVYSTVAILLIVVSGILISYVITKKRGKTGGLIDLLIMAPYVLPGSVLGLCYIITYNVKPLVLTGTAFIMILAMYIRTLPHTIRSGSAFLLQMDPSVEEASINLGVSPLKTFASVTARLMMPGVLSGAILSWISCINELSCSIMLYTGKTTTIAITVYSEVLRSSVGIAAALSSILVVVSGIVIMLCIEISKGKIKFV